MLNKIKTIFSHKKGLTDTACRGKNMNVKTIGKNILVELAPLMVRGFRSGDARTAPMVPHKPRAVTGVFCALSTERGVS